MKLLQSDTVYSKRSGLAIYEHVFTLLSLQNISDALKKKLTFFSVIPIYLFLSVIIKEFIF